MKTCERDLATTFAQSRATVSYWQERINAQIAFAKFLCTRQPKKASQWNKAIAEAEARAAQAVAVSGAGSLAKAMGKAEDALAPLVSTAKGYTLYCIGHAHIDMNWMWSWPETVSVTVDTITTVLRLMEEFPQFTFSQSQASVYRVLEEFAPQLLDQVRARVNEGRFEVTASHWVEGDKNMVDGESLCRHLLYTRQYMKQLLGLAPDDVQIDWSPDTFGHAHSVPTSLTRGGVRYVYMHRPGAHTKPQPRPEAFWWQAPDGSRVLVRNDMRRGYNGEIGPHMVSGCLQQFVEETGLPFSMFVYGVGDHGGGPTRRDLCRLADMQQWPVYPSLKAARAHEFFGRLEKEGGGLSTINDELNMEFAGCYTTQTLIKKANRYATKRLVEAETAAALATRVAGLDYPAAALTKSWRDTLFTHFHDILPGSCVHDSRTYAHGLYQQVTAVTSQAQTAALRALAARVDTREQGAMSDDSDKGWGAPRAEGGGGGRSSNDGGISDYGASVGAGAYPVMIYNPLPMARTEVVEVSVWDAGWGWEQREPRSIAFGARGPDGTLVRAQILDTGDYWGHRFVRVAFAATVPALGYAVYTVTENGPEWAGEVGAHQIGQTSQCSYSSYERSPEGLENEHVLVDIDTATGGIRRLVEKKTGAEIISADSASRALEHAHERNRSMNAWIVQHTNGWQGAEVVNIRRGHNGPYKATIDVDVRVRESRFTVTYELRQNDPQLYVHIRGQWVEYWTAERGSPALRFSLPLTVESLKTQYEIPFGAIERVMENGEEVPALRWAMVESAAGRKAKSDTRGLLLINDSKHGHSVLGNRLNLTLIRSTQEPDPLPEVGQHEVHLALRPLVTPLPIDQAEHAADRFDHALVAVSTSVHGGTLPSSASLVSVSGNVVLSSLKQAEDSVGWVVRVYNPTEKSQRAGLRVARKLCGAVARAEKVDALERAEKGRVAVGAAGTVTFDVPARAFQGVRVVFGK